MKQGWAKGRLLDRGNKMIRFIRESEIGGNIFTAPEQYKIVTINTVGAMGRGIAEECKRRYPSIYSRYRKLCREGIYPDAVSIFDEEGVILFATKLDWKAPSTFDIIRRSMLGLHKAIKENNISEIAVPPLGMANGWLKKHQRLEIFKLLVSLGKRSQCKLTVYLPDSLYEEVYALYH